MKELKPKTFEIAEGHISYEIEEYLKTIPVLRSLRIEKGQNFPSLDRNLWKKGQNLIEAIGESEEIIKNLADQRCVLEILYTTYQSVADLALRIQQLMSEVESQTISEISMIEAEIKNRDYGLYLKIKTISVDSND
jgi:hypothetical protein